MGVSRRGALGAFGAFALGALPGCRARTDASAALAAIERRLGGRLGVAAFATQGGARVGYRADERFAMCSTFKLALAGAVLARVDAGQEDLARRVPYGPDALLEYAPTTRAHVADGAMNVEALCEAAVTVSDNTAANLLLATLGGPDGLTRFARSLGDTVTRLDRTEPALNTALPGDLRDTTTPAAMLSTAKKLVLGGGALSEASRFRLLRWMLACRTGLDRLRAGLPAGWHAGDKTGTGANGAAGDIAIAWPPARGPIVIVAYTQGSSASIGRIAQAFAEVARVVAGRLGP